jgi:hypothetical protein
MTTRAWDIFFSDLPATHCIVFGKNVNKAKWACVKSYCEAFDQKPGDAFRNIRVKRAQNFDYLASREHNYKPFSTDHIDFIIKEFGE